MLPPTPINYTSESERQWFRSQNFDSIYKTSLCLVSRQLINFPSVISWKMELNVVQHIGAPIWINKICRQLIRRTTFTRISILFVENCSIGSACHHPDLHIDSTTGCNRNAIKVIKIQMNRNLTKKFEIQILIYDIRVFRCNFIRCPYVLSQRSIGTRRLNCTNADTSIITAAPPTYTMKIVSRSTQFMRKTHSKQFQDFSRLAFANDIDSD